MATSGSSNLSTTRNDLINGALRLIGVLDPEGGSATATQISNAAESLNFLTKSWMADGLQMWCVKNTSITLVDGTARYRCGNSQTVNVPKPLKIYEAYLNDSSSDTDTPLVIISEQDYYLLGNKTSEGTPSQMYYDPQREYGDIYLFPVPDATAASNKTLKIVYQRPIEDFDASTDEPDVPVEWFNALKWGLAMELAPEYGVSNSRYQLITQEAERRKMMAKGYDQENDSIMFCPERRWC
jgi:hypothetical protein